MDYAQSYCQRIGHVFDDNIIRLTALTGAAATEIKGTTTYSECKMYPRSTIDANDILLWKNTRLLVVDEISFGSYEDFLKKLSTNLQRLTEETNTPFGNMPILFIGDFLQLEPMGGKAMYHYEESLYWEMELNMMVELKGLWRFKDCPHLSKVFPEYRKHGMTEEIRKVFNTRVVGTQTNGKTVEVPDLRKVKVTTYTNKLKEIYNEAIFMEHLKMYHSKNEADPIPEFTVIVKGHASHNHNKRSFTYRERQTFFSKCTENNTRWSSRPTKRLAPLLKLFHMCELMGIDNDDVKNGVANGTTALFKYLKLKHLKTMHKICYNGYWVYAVNAEDVEFMMLEWTKDATFQGTFTISPSVISCKSTVEVKEFGKTEKIPWHIQLYQFKVTVNHATTGHKLQGKTVEQLVVGEWCNIKNWMYVVLSRVRTLEGLFLLEPLPSDTETAPHPQLTKMLNNLRNRILFAGDTAAIAALRLSQRIALFREAVKQREERKKQKEATESQTNAA